MDAFAPNGLVGSNDEIFKKNKFDISMFDDKAMETIKIASGGSFHSAIPIVGGFSALYYNKDLFNKFGVDYPKDGMSWKQVIELSKKVARTDGSTTYYGLNPDGLYRSAGQFSLPYVDSKTGNAVISSNPAWKRVFETQKEIYSIPGNPFKFEGKDNALSVFLRGQLAMYATDDHMQDSEKAGLNWDVVTYPEYEEKRGISLEYDLHIMGVTPTSKHQDAAFLVLKTLASDEVQKKLTMDGFVSARKAPEIKKLFAQNLSFAKNKNIAALFKTTPAVPAPPNPYSELQSKIRNEVAYTAGEKVFVQNIDINTALREADEAIDKMIAPLKNK
jgi:multiple sugar transport system substrate-binding protein